jgi:HNH endonuclease/AP2 domain
MVTQEKLRELFDYSPETGVFVRRKTIKSLKAGTQVGCLSQGYYRIRVDGVLYLAHRLAWLYMYGELPEFIDHINRVSTDNRISNLRPVTKKQNQENREKQRNNKSGVKGVNWDTNRNKWFACIQHHGKTIALGRYDDLSLADKAYKDAALRLHSHTNISQPEELTA